MSQHFWFDIAILIVTVLYCCRCVYLNSKKEAVAQAVLAGSNKAELVKASFRLNVVCIVITLIFLSINTWRIVALVKAFDAWGVGAIIVIAYFNLYAFYQIGLYHVFNNLIKFAKFKGLSG